MSHAGRGRSAVIRDRREGAVLRPAASRDLLHLRLGRLRPEVAYTLRPEQLLELCVQVRGIFDAPEPLFQLSIARDEE